MNRIYILLTGILMLCFHLLAENPYPPEGRIPVEPTPTVTLNMRQVPLLDILLELEKQTGVFFSYESSLLDELPKVSLNAHEESFSYCLKRLFAPLPVVYRIAGQTVVLKRKPRLYTISGFVRDSVSYESLINAAVIEGFTHKGTTSNNYGFYSITLPAGNVCLRSSYVGYKNKSLCIELTKDTLVDIQLVSSSALDEIVVTGTNRRSELTSSQLGTTTLTSDEIKRLPAILGEADLIKVLQHTPGVAMGTEALSNLYVRGGNVDENLILIDGNPVYQIGHLGGLFSAFNPDAVKLTGFYKGSFPARYGGRLSSVVDVRTKDGDLFEYHGSASIGLISGNLNLEGPIVKGKTSFNVAVRRTWLDAISAPAQAIIRAKKKESNDDLANFRYAFHDINAKINHRFSERSRLWLSVYSGEDVLKWKSEYSRSSGLEYEKEYYENFKLRWGNLMSSANWNYVFNHKLFANISAVYSRFHSDALFNTENKEGKKNTDFWEQISKEDRESNSWIQDIGYRMDFDYMPATSHHVKFGSDYLFHTFRPEFSRQILAAKDPENNSEYTVTFSDAKTFGHELSFYAEDDWTLSPRWLVNAGLRLSTFFTEGQQYTSLQPRLSARYRVTDNLSVKAAFAEMSQYVHLLSETYASLPTDLWVPVTKRVRPLSSQQISGGIYYRFLDMLDCSVEGYYKRMNNLIEYRDNRGFIPSYATWESQITVGKGRSYGVEFLVKKNVGKTTGWVGYTLSWSERLFDQLNYGNYFPFKYDNRHKLDVVVTHKLNKKIELTGCWLYSTGNWVTLPLEEFYHGSQPGNMGDMEGEVGIGSFAEKRNNLRMPAYHRLDVGVNIYRPKKNGRMGIWNFSLYNVYCRMNAFMLRMVEKKTHGPNGETISKKTMIQKLGLLPVIPSFSYTYKF